MEEGNTMTKSIDSTYAYKTTKFSKLDKSKMTQPHGVIAAWIKAHPNFTAAELVRSGICKAPNAIDYYEEFIAYRAFFKSLEND